jgi:hypothetical protein
MSCLCRESNPGHPASSPSLHGLPRVIRIHVMDERNDLIARGSRYDDYTLLGYDAVETGR